MAASQPPLGIMQLMALDRVIVSQKTTYFESNKYAVLAADKSLLMFANEERNAFGLVFGGSSRSFDMGIVDTKNNEVIRLRRPLTFGPDKMEVLVCGRTASVIRQKMTLMQPVLLVNDPADRPVLKIKGPKMGMSVERDFEVFGNKTRIGVIRKVWGGFGREMFSSADDFEISFPKDLDVHYKCALIAAAVLIDFLYYEN